MGAASGGAAPGFTSVTVSGVLLLRAAVVAVSSAAIQLRALLPVRVAAILAAVTIVLAMAMVAVMICGAFALLAVLVLLVLGVRIGAGIALCRHGGGDDERNRADNRLHFCSPKRVKL